MKRLAYIVYEFPPRGSTQSQHTAGLAEHLARLGWEVVVFTVADPPSLLIDMPALERVSRVAEVRPAYSLEPTRLLQSLRRLRRPKAVPAAPTPAGSAAAAPRQGTRNFSGLPHWAIRLVQGFFLPDEKIGWKPFALRELEAAHKEKPFDVMLATGQPLTSFSVAVAARKRLGVRWVADVRDPIVNGYFFKPLTPFHRWWMERFERRVVADAAWIACATQWIEDEIVERSPSARSRIETLPNTFRPEAFATLVPVDDCKFTISYVGTFQATIRPDTFLDALVALRDAGSLAFSDIRVRFVGGRDPETDAAIESRGLDGVVERTGFLPQDEAYQAMVDSDVLMVTLGPEPASAGIQTSKLPEYLGAGKTVLALVPDSDAGNVVRRAGAGPIVPPRDAPAAARAIEQLHEQWLSGTLPVPDPAVVAEFDRARVTKRFSEILEEVATGSSTGER